MQSLSPSMHQEEGDDSIPLETVIKGEGRDLNLCNNPTFV